MANRTIDPALLQPVSVPNTNIAINNDDINDANVAIAAAFSSDEELLRVINDSSDDDDEDCLHRDMVLRHLWNGFDIRYVYVL